MSLTAGVGSILGVSSTLRTLGVVRPCTVDAAPGASRGARETPVLNLGLGGAPCEFTHDCSQLRDFLAACRANQPSVAPIDGASSLAEAARQWRLAVPRIGVESDSIPTEGDVARSRSVVRKVLLGELATADRGFKWSDVSLPTLLALDIGGSDALASFPTDWTAEDVSRFCFDRGDWALLVPSFSCLWADAVRACGATSPAKLAALLACVESQGFAQVVEAHRRSHGVAPCPAVAALAAQACPPGSPAAKRRRTD